ncbi:hypothetical protein [Methylomagnum sp.]
MQAVINLPDELFIQAKAEAALRGIEFEDLLAQSLLGLLNRAKPASAELKAPLSLHEAMADCCGIAKDTPPDYSSNPVCHYRF